MAKGDNLKGPFLGLPHEAGAIAFVKCETCTGAGPDIYAPLKVNGHGWLIANCSSSDRCGARRGANAMPRAKALLKRATGWRAGAKKLAYEIAGLSEPEAETLPKTAPATPPVKRRRRVRVMGIKKGARSA